jgi:hypothetical protein
MPELAEGARLLSEYPAYNGIEGSNPSLSATNHVRFVATQNLSRQLDLVDSRVLRNKRLQTPSGPEGSSGSKPFCVPQGCLAINKSFRKLEVEG